jgi:single-strand DNA-binding protein
VASMNSYNFTGRLGSDPELRSTPSGASVCRLSVAVDTYGDKPTLWVDVSVWGKAGENCARYLSKGREVAIAGQVDDVRAYLKRDGEPGASLRVSTRDVSFIGSRGEDAGGFTPRSDIPTDAPAQAAPAAYAGDDDIPF